MAENLLRVKILADTQQFGKSLSSVSSKLKSLGSNLTSVGKNLSTRLTLPITILGGAAIKMASDFEESMNKVDVAFKQSSYIVKNFAKTTLTQFGIAQGTALDMAALFGDMSTSMGLSTNQAAILSTSLVGLAGDLASFKNMNIEEVTTALNGVFTGETESLKRLGVVMTQVNLLQFAQEQGIKKTWQEMTQAEKVMLRYNYVMKVTANAQGDFSRTSGGAANQTRIFQESLKELGTSFGKLILPIFTKIVQKANALIQYFNSLDIETKKIIITAAALGAALPPLIMAFGGLVTAIGVLTSPVALVVAGLVALFVASGDIMNIMRDLEITIKTALINSFSWAAEKVELFINTLNRYGAIVKKFFQEGFDADFTDINNQFDLLAENIKETGKAERETNTEGARLLKTYGKYPSTLKQIKDKFIDLKDSLFDFGGGTQEVKQNLNDVFRVIKPLTVTAKVKDSGIGLDPEKIKTTSESVKELGDKIKKGAENTEYWAGTIGGILADSFTVLLEGGDFFGSLMDALKKLIIRLAAAAAAAAVLFALTGGLSAGGSSLGAFKTIFAGIAGIPQFANGGIVSGPTLGLMGEYAGARSNPEVIAPLDKLKAMIGGGSQNVTVGGEFRIQGQDLVVALQRAERNRSRII